VTIGPTTVLTLDEARREARRLLADVLNGKDPSEDRRKEREASTFGDLARDYLRERSTEKLSGKTDEQRVRDHLIPAWGRRKAQAITRSDVAALHRRLGERARSTANRTVALVSVIYSWGERTGRLPEGHPNPARAIPKYPEKSRERFATQEEVGLIGRALDEEENVYLRGFVWLALLLGCRKNELLRIEWRDVDLENGLLHLRRTKSGRPFHLPLSKPARDAFHRIPREANNPYVFVGARPGSHLVNIDKAWRRIRDRAGVPDVRFHDLRRTVGSWMAQKQKGEALIGSVLGQSDARSTRVYTRMTDAGRRDALEEHAQAVLEAVRTDGASLEERPAG
jgi:integrase